MTRLNVGIGSLIGIMAFTLTGDRAMAYYKKTDSSLDPEVMKIDEKKFLGTDLNKDYSLVNTKGEEFSIKNVLGVPVILALSYYTCDGSCSTSNKALLAALNKVDRLDPVKDYKVLTVSFDKNDNLESLKMFEKMVNVPEKFKEAWNFALLRSPEEIERLTSSVGYRFYWSSADRMFLHPSVFIFLSPEGRVVRYLYSATLEKRDLELAIIEASKGNVSESTVTDLADLLLVACYSYSYKEGKYVWNYPLFIAVGSLLLGLTLMAVSFIVVYNKQKRKEAKV